MARVLNSVEQSGAVGDEGSDDGEAEGDGDSDQDLLQHSCAFLLGMGSIRVKVFLARAENLNRRCDQGS